MRKTGWMIPAGLFVWPTGPQIQPVSFSADRLYKEGEGMKFFVTSPLRGRSYRFVRAARLQPGSQI
jgi:hypothetical protein